MNKNILVVDDIKSNAYLLESLLKSKGYKAIVAANGKEALERLRDNNILLIISDILMPVMDGFQFCKICKNDNELKEIPFIIYTSSYTDVEDEKLALGMGADKFVRKPMEPTKFIKIVEKMIVDFKGGKLLVREQPIKEDKNIINEYSKRVFNKLEHKMVALEKEIKVRKKTEKSLRDNENRYRQIYQFSPDSIIIHDMDVNILDANNKAAQAFGYSKKELLKMKMTELHPKTEFKHSSQVLDDMKKKELLTVETKFQRKDGSVFIAEATPCKYMLESKQIIHVVIRDITKRMQATKEIKTLNEELEQRVIQRTSQLSAANKELESFSHSVSHDLRAPLRAIDGYTRILIEDYASKFDKEGQRLGTVIKENTKKMNKLIDDLLEFSRMGRTSMSISKIDMKNMVNAIYREVTSEKERKKINFTIDDLAEINGDSNLMRQVWTNLISNAVKFSSKREKAIISVACKADKDKLTYSITDNGAGFNMKYVDKIFGVFQRLHSDKEFVGTGIGLSLVQRIILRHNGKVWAEGEVDKGATFYFSLPKNAGNKK